MRRWRAPSRPTWRTARWPGRPLPAPKASLSDAVSCDKFNVLLAKFCKEGVDEQLKACVVLVYYKTPLRLMTLCARLDRDVKRERTATLPRSVPTRRP